MKVIFKNKEYTLTQEAYIAGTNENKYYEAAAIDENGNKYIVVWNILDNYNPEDGDDEGWAGDWEAPTNVYSI